MVVVTSLGPPEEGVKLKVDNVATYLNRQQLGMGSLYISEARVSWVGIQGRGFSLEYPHIALHAVSRDLTQFHQECLYLMIDVRLVDETGTPMTTPTSSEAGSDSEQEESDGGMTEIRFVPDDKAALDAMFTSMSECQVSVREYISTVLSDKNRFLCKVTFQLPKASLQLIPNLGQSFHNIFIALYNLKTFPVFFLF